MKPYLLRTHKDPELSRRHYVAFKQVDRLRTVADPDLEALPVRHSRKVTLEEGLALISRLLATPSCSPMDAQAELRIDDGRISKIAVGSPLRLLHPFVSVELTLVEEEIADSICGE